MTQTIGSRDPLRIMHRPLRDEPINGLPLKVEATVAHRSGIAQVRLWYRFGDKGPFREAPMIERRDTCDQWVGYLPAVYAPTTVSYYLEATARSGKRITRPMTAPTGHWRFRLTPLRHQALLHAHSATPASW